VSDLKLRDPDNSVRPSYRKTAAYGHFGRENDGFTWENRDKVDDLKSALGL
jgi:S-adenosylmethionine synthetase